MRKAVHIFLISMVLFSCSKSNPGKDRQAPVITIISPTNNQVFTAGQLIQTTASASDNDEVTELHNHVIDKATGNLLRDIHSYPGQKTCTVSDSFNASASVTKMIDL